MTRGKVPTRSPLVTSAWKIFILVLLVFSFLAVNLDYQSSADTPIVQMYLFYSPDCPDCKIIVDEYLPEVLSRFGDQLQVTLMDISDPQVYTLLTDLERERGIGSDKATIPEAFLGNEALLGAEEIQNRLEEVVQELLDAGGALYPAPEVASTPYPTPPVLPTNTPIPEGSREGAVHVMLFFSQTCPYCEIVREEFMPPLYEKYGEKLVVREFDVMNPYNYQLELAIQQAAGLPEDQRGFIPFMVVGRHLLTNATIIAQGLDPLIEEYLDQGGAPWPIDPKYFEPSEEATSTPAPTPAQTPTSTFTLPTPIPTIQSGAPVHMAYFTRAGCQECDRARYEINYLENKYDNLKVSVFDVTEYAELNEWLSDKAGVPERFHLTAPAIFLGEHYLVGNDVSTLQIEQLIQQHNETGAEPAWEGWEAEAGQAAQRIIERFRAFGILTIVLAGLIDGLNPCAFATIIFFVSYLAFTGRKGRDILLVGIAFALGVFITYFSVGLGLYQIIQRLPFLASLGKWIYGITAVICIVLAGLSLIDYVAARRGKPEEMRLRLPLRLRRKINALIRDSANTRAFVAVAFVTGFAISLIELACTGQVYLPTILFVMGVPELRGNAVLYLLLYNLMFITPLLIVFVLAYLGTTSEQMGQFVNKNTAKIKLATAGLFLVLAAWLIFMVVA